MMKSYIDTEGTIVQAIQLEGPQLITINGQTVACSEADWVLYKDGTPIAYMADADFVISLKEHETP